MEFLIGIAVVIGIIFAISNGKEKARKINQLKETYDSALRGTNKVYALQAGRAYYSALRSPKQLTIYDEQAITNDLSTMKV